MEQLPQRFAGPTASNILHYLGISSQNWLYHSDVVCIVDSLRTSRKITQMLWYWPSNLDLWHFGLTMPGRHEKLYWALQTLHNIKLLVKHNIVLPVGLEQLASRWLGLSFFIIDCHNGRHPWKIILSPGNTLQNQKYLEIDTPSRLLTFTIVFYKWFYIQ